MHPRSKAAVGLLATVVPFMLAIGIVSNAELFSWPILTAALGVTALAAAVGRSMLTRRTEDAFLDDSDEKLHEPVVDSLKDKVILWLVIAATMAVTCMLALHLTK